MWDKGSTVETTHDVPRPSTGMKQISLLESIILRNLCRLTNGNLTAVGGR